MRTQLVCRCCCRRRRAHRPPSLPVRRRRSPRSLAAPVSARLSQPDSVASVCQKLQLQRRLPSLSSLVAGAVSAQSLAASRRPANSKAPSQSTAATTTTGRGCLWRLLPERAHCRGARCHRPPVFVLIILHAGWPTAARCKNFRHICESLRAVQQSAGRDGGEASAPATMWMSAPRLALILCTESLGSVLFSACGSFIS